MNTKIVAYSDPENPTTNKPTGAIFDRWIASVLRPEPRAGRPRPQSEHGQAGYFLAYYRHSCPTNYHFVPARLWSACEPDNCKAGQFWDAAKNQCETSSCFAGETCGHFMSKDLPERLHRGPA